MTTSARSVADIPMWLDGRPATSLTGQWVVVRDPSDSTELARVPAASVQDLDRAVAAGRRAFASGVWSRAIPADRAAALLRLATLMEECADELAETEARNTGKTLRMAREFDVAGSVDNVRFFAGAARALEGKAAGEYMAGITSFTRREPIGVVGSIAPWNYPLQMAVWKILPAIAAGNSVILKPASSTPLTALRIGELASRAGVPDGVVNVVTGPGSVLGPALAEHPDIDMVALTGDVATGVEVMRRAAGGLKRVHLELGGKAPFIVFADADLDAAANGAIAGGFINVGQDCTAATRIYVEQDVYARFRDLLLERVALLRVGDPFDPLTDLGPLISLAHRDRVAGFVERARDAGARIAIGGLRPSDPALDSGAYFLPTVIEGAAQDAEITQCEVFGPVLVLLPFDGEAQAIRLANDVGFGLAGSVWTADVGRAMRLSGDLHFGTVWVNEHIPITSEMPHGGFKRSGTGKDMSQYSLEEYTIVKHVAIDIEGRAHKPWHDIVWHGDGGRD
ncbi:MAG TPA: aminobutyraldehyde dehydrogenase [Candidatus Limnocylindrales bacterium]|nr:aminobutyraldehyde dehydrogenase [Candidatus Limnocylindrales bacterium]